MTPTATADPATAAYEALAPFYDAYTHSYDHHRWLGNLEAIALQAGLQGHRLLDVACGTGKSFMPMLDRGYEVVACDISPAMVERARQRSGLDHTDVFVADMRDLPRLGTFDLATCLDDSLNYLLSAEELERALVGVARNLRPGGLFIFDTNSLAVYGQLFSQDRVVENEETLFCWRGTGKPAVAPGATCQATIEIFSETDGERWTRTSSRHLQRHHDPKLVRELLPVAGFELVGLYGQVTGAKLEQPVDEDRHLKLVYFCRRTQAGPALGTEGR
ncbi:MAG: class I SAM-dependent methyltransferase [Actinomycetota bacterium]|nr:class I SAM-dependent methyltransferase [Actinomycetota bacterium]